MEFTVDNTRWSHETVRFIEHVVLTISLEVRGYEQEYTEDDFFDYHATVGNDTEQLVAWLTDEHPRRGDIQIELTSPMNTTSKLLPYRDFDFVNSQGYKDWPFMTVHNWGENPHGTWTLKIMYKSSLGYVHVDGVELTLYGTSLTPESVRSIPPQCDEACSRGCSGEGPSNCDVCKQLRLESTLECVDKCPPGHTEYNSYCLCDNCESENVADYKGDNGVTEGDRDSGDGVQWSLSLILSVVVSVVILVIFVIACYFAVQIVRQHYCHKKKLPSFTRLQDNISSV